jgi:ketosteroid isomerase-like protein
MSQENVEVLRELVAAWNAGDMDAVREIHAPDVVTRPPDGWPEPGPFVGRAAVMRQWNQMRDTWDADQLRMIGAPAQIGDRIALRLSWLGSGHGPESTFEVTGVYTVRDGTIASMDFFWDHAEALDAVGQPD